MNQFNLGQFLTKVIDYSLSGIRGSSTESAPKSPPSAESFSQNMVVPSQSGNMPKPPVMVINAFGLQQMPILQNLQMNHLESLDRALYVKDLMNLPKDMGELLKSIQKNVLVAEEMPAVLNTISISEIALLLQQNGKEAVNKLIMTMSNAAKQGITDFSQIKDAIKLINASVSTAGQNNPSQTIKSLMLLYLPWLPLQESVGFELEVETFDKKSGDADSYITIMISTKNYGNVKVTLVLLEGNSVNILVNCSEKFPKEELLKKLKTESKSHSIQSSVVFEQKAVNQSETVTRQAKVNVSNATDVNPFLLLMAQAVIRHTIELDTLAG